jgi:CHAT domain-containing protein
MVRPVLSSINDTDSLTVELDNSLANLPMEAIYTPDGTYLGARYSIVYSPGSIAEMSLRPARTLDQRARALIVQSALPGLPGYDAERHSINELFPRTKIISGGTTPWLSVLRETATADVVHFAGHGQRDGENTALAIATLDRSVLRAQDFLPRYLTHLELAVLAACSTGVGGDNGLLDTRNLVHPFLAAGVPSVIASHWNVDSAATALLMNAFYAGIHDGEDAPKALFEARKKLMISHRHPYYWAGFSINGRMM